MGLGHSRLFTTCLPHLPASMDIFTFSTPFSLCTHPPPLPCLLLELYLGKHWLSCTDFESPKDTRLYHLAHSYPIYPYSSRPTLLPPGVYLAIVNRTGEPTHPRPHSQAAGSNPDTPSSVLWTPSGYRGRVRDGPEVRLLISRDWRFLPAQSPGAAGNRAQRK